MNEYPLFVFFANNVALLYLPKKVKMIRHSEVKFALKIQKFRGKIVIINLHIC